MRTRSWLKGRSTGIGVCLGAGVLIALVSSGCSIPAVQERRGTQQIRYFEQQARGSARVLGQRFKELEEIVPSDLTVDADLLAEDWHALAIGDIDRPPCDQMRAAYEALGNWLVLRSERMFTDASVPLETKLNWTHIEATAMNWQFNDECKEFLLGSANVQ